MRNWMFIISVFLLASCDEVVYLRNDEKPVLVLNAVLEAGCDSMRIELTETKGTYDQSPWQRFQDAEVRVYEEGELLGVAEYQPADDAFVLWKPVKAEKTYRIEAQVAGKETVWGETRVPEEIVDCKAELWYERKEIGDPRWTANYDWTDTPDKKNYYWYCVDRLTYDHDGITLIWQSVSILESESYLPDLFNRWSLLGEEGEYPERGYADYIRILDEGIDGQEIEFSYSTTGGSSKVLATMLNVDQHLDAYQKSAIDWQNNAFPFDGEMTWTLHHVPIYSNVHGGAGLVGSYVPMETVLRLWNLNEAEEGAVFGPGERVK